MAVFQIDTRQSREGWNRPLCRKRPHYLTVSNAEIMLQCCQRQARLFLHGVFFLFLVIVVSFQALLCSLLRLFEQVLRNRLVSAFGRTI